MPYQEGKQKKKPSASLDRPIGSHLQSFFMEKKSFRQVRGYDPLGDEVLNCMSNHGTDRNGWMAAAQF